MLLNFVLPNIPPIIAHLAIFQILSGRLSFGFTPPPSPPSIAPFLALENGESSSLTISALSFLPIPSASPLAI
nr:MAG TPA: hypothetical protein [Caudoviricetes sp.]